MAAALGTVLALALAHLPSVEGLPLSLVVRRFPFDVRRLPSLVATVGFSGLRSCRARSRCVPTTTCLSTFHRVALVRRL